MAMKMIVAVIQPFMLAKVTHALEHVDGFPGITIEDVRGFGREKATHEHREHHRLFEDVVDYVKKVRLEIVAHDDMVESIVTTIVQTAHTGNPGDGKVFVWPVESAVRIMTSEHGEKAV
jgi:nitrogen regulatory protein P-II 1